MSRKFYTVMAKHGLNLRREPSKEAEVLKVLPFGEKVTVDAMIETPENWVAVKGGGYVVKEFLK